MATDKHYVSNIDKKLSEFDKNHPRSASQQAEIAKHRRIFKLRDNPSYLPSEQDDNPFKD